MLSILFVIYFCIQIGETSIQCDRSLTLNGTTYLGANCTGQFCMKYSGNRFTALDDVIQNCDEAFFPVINQSLICGANVCLMFDPINTPPSSYSQYLCCCNTTDLCNTNPQLQPSQVPQIFYDKNGNVVTQSGTSSPTLSSTSTPSAGGQSSTSTQSSSTTTVKSSTSMTSSATSATGAGQSTSTVTHSSTSTSTTTVKSATSIASTLSSTVMTMIISLIMTTYRLHVHPALKGAGFDAS